LVVVIATLRFPARRRATETPAAEGQQGAPLAA
jgi:hypothetical protein